MVSYTHPFPHHRGTELVWLPKYHLIILSFWEIAQIYHPGVFWRKITKDITQDVKNGIVTNLDLPFRKNHDPHFCCRSGRCCKVMSFLRTPVQNKPLFAMTTKALPPLNRPSYRCLKLETVWTRFLLPLSITSDERAPHSCPALLALSLQPLKLPNWHRPSRHYSCSVPVSPRQY